VIGRFVRLQPPVGRIDPFPAAIASDFIFRQRGNERRSAIVCSFRAVLAGNMFDLIRLVQRWLRPAEAETSAEVPDTSSMADLVRLLGTEQEPADGAEGQGSGPANDAGGSAS
jgi:hypothetical protein